jgi:hypothetical protein
MHTDQAARSHSVWADLDALVLEEVDALDRPPAEAAEPPRFGSEDEFVAEAAYYLRHRTNPEHLIGRLYAELGIAPDAAEMGGGEEPGLEDDHEIDGVADELDATSPQAVPASPQSEAAAPPTAPDSAAS